MTDMPDDADDHLLLHALADGELEPAEALALEARIAADPALARAYETILALKHSVMSLEQPAVSDEFAARIAGLTTAPAAAVERPAMIVRLRRIWATQDMRSLAAAVVITAFLAGGVTHFLDIGRPGFSMEDAVAGSHRRSLLAANPVDIVTSDRHTVKPWLDAKLGISPPATDLAASGYPLVGGRVDVLGTNAVPTLVYRHNEHLITLIAAPGPNGTTAPASETADGYNLVHWTEGGFSFWAVSDLEAGELADFVGKYRPAGG